MEKNEPNIVTISTIYIYNKQIQENTKDTETPSL